MIELELILSFVLSFLLVIYGTPIIRKVAFRYNLMDIPDNKLKKQKEPVPYMGGVIVYFAVIAPVSLFPVFQFSQEFFNFFLKSQFILKEFILIISFQERLEFSKMPEIDGMFITDFFPAQYFIA